LSSQKCFGIWRWNKKNSPTDQIAKASERRAASGSWNGVWEGANTTEKLKGGQPIKKGGSPHLTSEEVSNSRAEKDVLIQRMWGPTKEITRNTSYKSKGKPLQAKKQLMETAKEQLGLSVTIEGGRGEKPVTVAGSLKNVRI